MFDYKKKLKISKWDKDKIEYRFFLLGILFLASAPFISVLLFIFPLFIKILKNKNQIIRDKDNFPFILASFLILLKSFYQTFVPIDNNLGKWEHSLNWLGLVNWIPLFLCYFGFKHYLDNHEKRLKVSKLFIIGTVPVIISCLGQFFFKWYGPFEIMNGLIKWFQRPLIYNQNVTGLFNNPNYAGIWLTMVFPLTLAVLNLKFLKAEKLKSILVFIIASLLSISTILTNSRGAWIGLLITIPIFYGQRTLKWFIPALFLMILIILFSFLPFVPNELQTFANLLTPEIVSSKFSEITIGINTFPRLTIWKEALNFIGDKPFWGWGAGTFPYLFGNKTNAWNGHAHNLFLEISVSYGLIVSTLIFGKFIYILVNSFKKIFIKKENLNIIEKGWWCSGIIFFLAQSYDVFYFDVRINLASWIFIIGLSQITKNGNSKIIDKKVIKVR